MVWLQLHPKEILIWSPWFNHLKQILCTVKKIYRRNNKLIKGSYRNGSNNHTFMPSCLRWREQCPRPTQSSPPNPIGSTLLVALKLLSIYNMRCKANDSSSYIIICILIIIHIFSLFLIWLLVLMPFIFNYGAKWSNKPWEMTWERMVVVDCPLWTPFLFSYFFLYNKRAKDLFSLPFTKF